MSTDHNFQRERRAEADSNRGLSAYQPNALPLDPKPAHLSYLFACLSRNTVLSGFHSFTPSYCTEERRRNTAGFLLCSVEMTRLVRVTDCFLIPIRQRPVTREGRVREKVVISLFTIHMFSVHECLDEMEHERLFCILLHTWGKKGTDNDGPENPIRGLHSVLRLRSPSEGRLGGNPGNNGELLGGNPGNNGELLGGNQGTTGNYGWETREQRETSGWEPREQE